MADTRLRFLIRELSEASEEDLKETDVVLLCFSLETSVSLARVVSSSQYQERMNAGGGLHMGPP